MKNWNAPEIEVLGLDQTENGCWRPWSEKVVIIPVPCIGGIGIVTPGQTDCPGNQGGDEGGRDTGDTPNTEDVVDSLS